MAELRNCPSCNGFFNYTGMRDVCHNCAQIEEDQYQVVYRFLRKRENRAANVDRIVEATGVERDLLYNWVRKGRLPAATFPKHGDPCGTCGRLTQSGELCEECQNELKAEWRTLEAAQDFREEVHRKTRATYLSEKK